MTSQVLKRHVRLKNKAKTRLCGHKKEKKAISKYYGHTALV